MPELDKKSPVCPDCLACGFPFWEQLTHDKVGALAANAGQGKQLAGIVLIRAADVLRQAVRRLQPAQIAAALSQLLHAPPAAA